MVAVRLKVGGPNESRYLSPALTTTAFPQKGHVMATGQSADTSASERVRFKEIDGYPGYFVGSDGSVWSSKQKIYLGRHGCRVTDYGPWHRLKPNPKDYYHVGLAKNGRMKTFTVHALVLRAFRGPCPDGLQGCHNNGDSYDNRLSNLRWDTILSNHNDKRIHGTMIVGSGHAEAKLTEADIPVIMARVRAGEKQKDVAADYGVDTTTLSVIFTGRGWTHVTRMARVRPPGVMNDRSGEANPKAKLTVEKVAEMRRLFAAGGVTKKALADRYGITLPNACKILLNQTWVSKGPA